MEYAALADVTKRDHFTFGGGRRICPGSWVAERSMFLNLARLLWGFNIEHAKDENGNIIPVDFTTDGLVPGALSNAKPFACCMFPSSPPFPPFRCPGGCFLFLVVVWRLIGVAITVRSQKRANVLRKEWAEAQKVGVDFSTIRYEIAS